MAIPMNLLGFLVKMCFSLTEFALKFPEIPLELHPNWAIGSILSLTLASNIKRCIMQGRYSIQILCRILQAHVVFLNAIHNIYKNEGKDREKKINYTQLKVCKKKQTLTKQQ